jgi:hypothetical protein
MNAYKFNSSNRNVMIYKKLFLINILHHLNTKGNRKTQNITPKIT